MHSLILSRTADYPYQILCVGAHADDIEIGCGGTVLQLLELYRNSEFYWVVLSSNAERSLEAESSASNFLANARRKRIVIEKFRESFLPYHGSIVKEYFEHLKNEMSPDIIFTHYRNDLHQDHRCVSEITWQTFRNHLILEYEIPKYDGDLGTPTVFVPLDQRISNKKIQYILEGFKSQTQRSWFDQETFLSMLRLRGMECNAPSKYAEAFYCRKTVIGLVGTHDAKHDAKEDGTTRERESTR